MLPSCNLSFLNQTGTLQVKEVKETEKKVAIKKEGRVVGHRWEAGDTELLRHSHWEKEWGLADGKGRQLPVVDGRQASGDYMVKSGHRL